MTGCLSLESLYPEIEENWEMTFCKLLSPLILSFSSLNEVSDSIYSTALGEDY